MFNKKNTLFIIFSIIFSFFILDSNIESRIIKRVEFCHFKENKGKFVKRRLPKFLVFLHLRFHDNDKLVPESGDCNEEQAPMRNFALAYIDVDNDGSYDENVDVLISRFEDTNGDDVFSAGDTIYFGNYPTNFDPCPEGECLFVGTFTLQEWVLTEEEVQGITSIAGESLTTGTGIDYDYRFIWVNSTLSTGAQNQVYRIFTQNSEMSFIDFVNIPSDSMAVYGNYLEFGDSDIPEQSVLDQEDNYFLNIEMDNPDFTGTHPGNG